MTIFYTKKNFQQRLAQGNKTEQHVADKLVQAGVIVVKPEYPEGMPTNYYTKNQVDLLANDHVLEIKGRNMVFNSVEDYKYDTIFVEGVTGFDRKVHTPAYYVTVSNVTGAIIALDVKATRDTWTVEKITDRQRHYSYDMYVSRTADWMNFDRFIEELNK